MEPRIPEALRNGHANLRSELGAIKALNGKIGEKARILDAVMSPHFKKEEGYALPPLGFLLALSSGNWEIDADVAIKMAEELASKLSELKKDHENIAKALQNLKIVADEENNLIGKQFVKDLTMHADIEDQVLYPTTILIGNYLKHMKQAH